MRARSRRGLTLTEILVALALLTLLLIPALTLLGPGGLEVSARQSAAGYLVNRLLTRARRIPYKELQELYSRGAEVANGYRELPMASLLTRSADGADPLGLGPLKEVPVKAFLRVLPHVGGQYGLDRVDVKVAYGTGEKPRWMTRSFVRRNARELTAMSRLRLYRPTDTMTDEQVHDAIRTIAAQTALLPMAERDETSVFLRPTYPGILRYFQEFEKDPQALDDEGLIDGLGTEKGFFTWGDTLAEGSAPRPPFSATAGICD